jgi:pyruvate/2-oxoglutarate dehydrogenase complex dihydrolipoamide dehydrogenase (E3) component
MTRTVLKAGAALRIADDPARLRLMSRAWMPIGDKVAIVGGELVGLELAEFLAERGRDVTVLESGPHLGLPMAMPRRWAAVRAAAARGVGLERNAVVKAIDAHQVTYCVGDEIYSVAADDVLVASGVQADHSFAEMLSQAGFDVRTIGDAAEVGYIDGAIHAAWALAEKL